MIAITTPTGSIGSKVVEQLLDRDEPLRLIARDPDKLPARVREATEVIQGSHGDTAVIDRALDGVDALLWLVAPNPQADDPRDAYVGFTRPAVKAAKAHGVQHVVVVSALGREYEKPAGMLTLAQQMVDLWYASGIATRELAMPGFMENVLGQVGAIENQGTFYGTTPPDLTGPHVATRDIAAVAAGLLADRSWSGQEVVPVLGPEDLTFEEVAVELSEGLGRTVTYTHIPVEALRQQLVGQAGFSDAAADQMVEMFVAKNDGIDTLAERTPQATTPTTYREWAADVLKPALSS